MPTILTHSGTATETVRKMLKVVGLDLKVISKLDQLKGVKYSGVILLGGSDINPFFYGETVKHNNGMNHDRDGIEWMIVRNAMTKKLPIMGICRGHQMITVAHGGSLHQDIDKENVSKTHRLTSAHRIGVTGPLADHIPSDYVNSFHHQAVKVVPDGFKVLARSTDGVIESIWKPGVLGVQWHPELMFDEDYRWISLFKWFAKGLK